VAVCASGAAERSSGVACACSRRARLVLLPFAARHRRDWKMVAAVPARRLRGRQAAAGAGSTNRHKTTQFRAAAAGGGAGASLTEAPRTAAAARGCQLQQQRCTAAAALTQACGKAQGTAAAAAAATGRQAAKAVRQRQRPGPSSRSHRSCRSDSWRGAGRCQGWGASRVVPGHCEWWQQDTHHARGAGGAWGPPSSPSRPAGCMQTTPTTTGLVPQQPAAAAAAAAGGAAEGQRPSCRVHPARFSRGEGGWAGRPTSGRGAVAAGDCATLWPAGWRSRRRSTAAAAAAQPADKFEGLSDRLQPRITYRQGQRGTIAAWNYCSCLVEAAAPAASPLGPPGGSRAVDYHAVR
jgi:hypothetical protein